MGLAASQARFLCITARKTNCEYKSTDLAQQKLEITNQLADISNTYSNAMNSTKLMWDNENCESATSLSYGLLMSPSAANDYNPYMLSTTAGAIVLNSEYAAAAKAAGLSKAGGGMGSQDSRDKFISALAYSGNITDETAKQITVTDYTVDEEATKAAGSIQFSTTSVSDTNSLVWDTLAGVGGIPKDKYAADSFTLSELCLSDIGKTTIDWTQIDVAVNDAKKGSTGWTDKVSEQEYNEQLEAFDTITKAATNGNINKQVLAQLQSDYSASAAKDTNSPSAATKKYQKIYELAQSINNVDKEGYIIDDSGNRITASEITPPCLGSSVGSGGSYSSGILASDLVKEIVAQFNNDKTEYKNTYNTTNGTIITMQASTYINTDATKLDSTDKGSGTTEAKKKLFVVNNGIIQTGDSVSEIDIAEVLTGNITLISGSELEATDTNNNGSISDSERLSSFKNYVTAIFDSVVKTLGYEDGTTCTGVGLNVDDTSAEALSFAYDMTIKQFMNHITKTGGDKSQSSLLDNKAYVNAEENNTIGTNTGKTNYAVSLSNMLSSFLSYYDNKLNGVDSPYFVGTSVETSEFVTEDAGYQYLGKLNDPDEALEMREKVADFYDELYNNILEHGWREDSSIDDSEYMEQCIKNGTYSLTSLNELDGYYYQSRYNETGYINEVSDEDAIARAEAEFTAKKAELTYKEDKIDIQTKQLDAEISSLSTEYDTVKQLISKSIEKTFAMFSN